FRMWGLATPQGLDPLLPGRYRAMVKPWARFTTSRVFFMDYRNEPVLQSLGVRYAITYQGSAEEGILAHSPSFHRLTGSSDSFYRVYEYLHAKAPFGFDGVEGDARPEEWMPERRVFHVRSEQGGKFGLVEEFFPGWSASVDGRAVAIARWRDNFQSIEV